MLGHGLWYMEESSLFPYSRLFWQVTFRTVLREGDVTWVVAASVEDSRCPPGTVAQAPLPILFHALIFSVLISRI